jgi:hypothetical protein
MGYAFVTLTPAQVEERRRQLDLAGFQAWLSPIVILTAVYMYRRITNSSASPSTSSSTSSSKSGTDDSSLQGKHQGPSVPAKSESSVARTLNTTYVREFGPLHVQLLGLMYLSWLLWLVFRGTGDDYMHLAKSFGHVAVSQLPMHYLLALRLPDQKYSPLWVTTGLDRQRLNPYHRLFGRLVHGLLATHAVMYLRFFVKMDVLAKRIQHLDVRLGLAAFWSFNILAVLAIPPIRRKYRAVFYKSHVGLSALVLPILFFHVPYTRFYVVQAGVVWLVTGFVALSTSGKWATRQARILGRVKPGPQR